MGEAGRLEGRHATALPDLTTIGNVIDAAAKIAPGEAARQAAEGAKHIPMALPSAAEVAAVHADAVAKRAEPPPSHADR